MGKKKNRRGKGSEKSYNQRRLETSGSHNPAQKAKMRNKILARYIPSCQFLTKALISWFWRSEKFQNHDFTVTNPALVTSSGWQGAPPPAIVRSEIIQRFKTQKIKQDLAKFTPIPYIKEPV
jgi:hypothetical protein